MTIHTITLNPVTDLIYLVDRFEKGTTFRSNEFLTVPAGKGINVSYILSCFGEPSTAHVLIGDDEEHTYRNALQARSIRPELTVAQMKTRKHCTLIESSTNSVTHAQTHSRPVDPQYIEKLESNLFPNLQDGDIAVFSGSLPKGVDNGLYKKWIKQCHDQNVLPVFDSSGEALRQGIQSSPWILKANEHEAVELIGKPIHNENEIQEAAQSIQSKYCIDYVIISLGSRGIAAATKHGYYRLQVNIDEEKIIDSVGCGDAIAGGFLFAWTKQKDEKESFAYAIATATSAATLLGPGNIKPEVVNELYKQVSLNLISSSDAWVLGDPPGLL